MVDRALPKTGLDLELVVSRGLAVVKLPPDGALAFVTLLGLYPPTFPNTLLALVVIVLAVVDDPS